MSWILIYITFLVTLLTIFSTIINHSASTQKNLPINSNESNINW